MPGRRAATFGADRARRAAETDRWLVSLLGGEAGVALVAVGGYGRRELLPGSDLDVLLLHAGRPDRRRPRGAVQESGQREHSRGKGSVAVAIADTPR